MNFYKTCCHFVVDDGWPSAECFGLPLRRGSLMCHTRAKSTMCGITNTLILIPIQVCVASHYSAMLANCRIIIVIKAVRQHVQINFPGLK